MSLRRDIVAGKFYYLGLRSIAAALLSSRKKRKVKTPESKKS